MFDKTRLRGIRKAHRLGASYRALAKILGVSHMTIARIVRREGRYK